MTFAPLVLAAALVGAAPADPGTEFDFKKYSLDYQVARNKELTKAKVPAGEQPPFAALLPLLERGTAATAADPKSAAAVSVRKHVAMACALYPADPKARELMAAALADLSAADAVAVRFQAVQAIDRAVGNPTTARADVPKLLAESFSMLARIEKDLPALEKAAAERAGDRVTALRHVLKTLSPGNPAPAVECKDLDGKLVKLSDYKGKVVVLDVWTTGCLPCRAMIPHQRELVERLKDRPFALVSVSFDEKPEAVTEFLKGTPMPWVHWFNGHDGGMADAYKINHFPTIYVIDAAGVIRFKEVRGTRLDEAVDALLAAPTEKPKVEPAPVGAAAPTREEQLNALKAEFAKKNSEAMRLPRTGTAEEQLKAYQDALPKMKDFAQRAFAIADKGAADEVAFQALAFVATTGAEAPEGTDAFQRMAKRFAAAPGAAKVLESPTATRASVVPFAERVIAVHPDRSTRAAAAVLLTNLAIRRSERAETPAESAAASAEAEAMLQRIIDDFAGAKLGGKLGTADQWAKSMLPEVVDLAVGKPFPNVSGEGMDGKALKVSDYRGKVVVFDVWATWCGPCRAMIPHERELVARLADKPFVLISASGDAEKDTLATFLKTTEMPWTHWWCGGDGREALKALHIHHFPTIYVLDDKGVIRYKGVRGKKMDEAVDALLKELEGHRKG